VKRAGCQNHLQRRFALIYNEKCGSPSMICHILFAGMRVRDMSEVMRGRREAQEVFSLSLSHLLARSNNTRRNAHREMKKGALVPRPSTALAKTGRASLEELPKYLRWR
jgi:hypothetical protein